MIVDIPGVGQVEFPDTMSDAQVADAIKNLLANTAPAVGNVTPPAQEQAVQGQASQQAQDSGISNLSSLGYGLQNGAYFGFDDEIAGLDNVVMNPLDWAGAGDNYRAGRDRMRSESAAAQDANPNFFMGGDIGGSIVTSLATLPGAAGKGLLGVMARATGIGAIEGAAMGAGNADGRPMLPEMSRGGLLGAGLGAAAVPVAAGLRAVGRMVADPIRGATGLLTGRASQALAARPINRAIFRSGMDIPTIENRIAAANADGQHMYALADALGLPGQRLGSTVARSPGEGRTELVEWLNARQAGQGERVGSFVADALGASDTAAQRQASLTAARSADANVNYPAAAAGAAPVNLNSALDVIDNMLRRDPILGQTALSQGPLGSRLMAIRNRMERGGEQLIDFESVLNLKSDMFQQMQLNPRVAADLRPTYQALDAALEDASGGYRLANDTFRTQSGVIDAVDAGTGLASPRMRTEDATAAYSAMTPEQQAAARAGYADPMLARIENTPPGTNAIRAFTTPKNGALMGLLSDDPALWARRAERENTMFETRRQATGGSQTADNLADAADIATPNIEVLANIFAGRFGNAAGLLGKKALTMFTGMNEQTRNVVARALMSQNPVVDLAPLVAQGLVNARILRAVETTLRQSGLRATGVTPGLLSAQ